MELKFFENCPFRIDEKGMHIQVGSIVCLKCIYMQYYWQAITGIGMVSCSKNMQKIYK